MSSNIVTKATLGKNSFQIDSSGGTGDTYGILSGLVNGINTVYTVSLGSYVSGSLEVQLNGQLLTQGTAEDWVETTPSSGTFTLSVAPESGDILTIKYQFQTVTTGNADTLDGHHSTDFVTNTVAGEFENKIIDATKNTISNLDTDNLASGVLDTDLSSVSASDDTIPSAKATKAMGDLKLAKTTNITALNETGIADGEIAVFNLTSKDIRTSNTTIATSLGSDDTTIPTNKVVKDSIIGGLCKQALINGNFDVWQRNDTIANTSANSYTADRWYVDTATAGDDKTVTKQTSDVLGSLYSCRVQRVAGETGHTVLRLSQALETKDSIKLRGQKLTLSFYLKVGANFSATSNILTAKILTGKGTDEKATAFTTSADAISSDITATTTSVKYTLTTTNVIASDITQIGVSFSYDPTGTAGANDWFEITQVQLNVGTEALPFTPKSYGEELRLCQRFFQRIDVSSTTYFLLGLQTSSTAGKAIYYLKEQMRIAPTSIGVVGTFGTRDGSGTHSVTGFVFASSTPDTVEMGITAAGTEGRAMIVYGTNPAYITFDGVEF